MDTAANGNIPVFIDTTTPNTKILLTINMSNVTKLTSANYLMWSLQIHALLDGYDLAGYLDGSIAVPPPTLTTDDQIFVNPEFTIWKRLDRLIYSSLIGAISSSLQPLVSRATTTQEAWVTLASTYAKPSHGHIKQLKTQLKNWKKETKTIDVYLQGITTRLDQLAILRKPVDHEDQIDLILEGLTEDYKPVIDQAEGHDVPPSITELHERLLNHEAKLLNSGEALLPNGPVTVNVAQQRNNHTSNRNFNKQKNNYQGPQQSTTQQWNNSQQTNRYDNKGQRPYPGCCQICGVQGHSAKRCPQLQNFQAGTQQQQMTPFTPSNPRANYTVANPYNAQSWLMDSGATHHITSDLDAPRFINPTAATMM